jgi:hypothetical protein
MTYVPYSYKHPSARRYVFISIGKKRIEKVVDFTPLKAKNTMNLSFGDLMADGSINYKANSNNGDILRVLATVVDILRHFTSRYPEVVIFFTGSTTERTRLYARILKTYYALFSKDFILYGVVGTESENKVIPFDPQSGMEYLVFLIKRIN